MKKLVIAAVVLAIAIILIWQFSGSGTSDFQPQTVQLSSGARLHLHHVTYGTTHEKIIGDWRERMALRLPRGLSRALGLRRAAVEDVGKTTNGPTMIFWLRCEGEIIPVHELVFGMADESGYETPLFGHRWWSLSSLPPTTNQTIYPGTTVFPRRGREIQLRVYRQDRKGKLTRIALYRVPNPAPSTAPRWKPERLPQQRTNDGLNVTLVKWRPATRPTAASNPNKDDDTQWSKAVFDFPERSRWETAPVQWRDATGNLAENFARSGWVEGTQMHVEYQPALWTNEGAWKLRAGFSRGSKGPFNPDEIWEVKNVRAPGTNEFVRTTEQARVQGALLQIEALVGPRTLDGPVLPYIGRILVVRRLDAKEPVKVQLLDVTDNQGRPVPLAGRRNAGTETGWEFGVDVPADATAVNFRIAVQRFRWVEFMVPTM